jgi:O-antigen/teichoic acid export membrane protein
LSADEQRTAHPGPVGAGRRKAAAVHVLTNYLSVAVVVAKGVLLVPLYLRSFGIEGYGAWLASGNVLSLIAVVESGFTVVYAQRLSAAHGDQDGRRFGRVLGSGGAMLAVASVVLVVVAVSVSRLVPSIVNADRSTATVLPQAFSLAGLGAGLTLLQTVVFSVFYAWQRPLVVGVVKLGAQAVELICIVWGLYLGMGLLALGTAAVVAGGAGLVVAVILVARALRLAKIEPTFNFGEIKGLAYETLPQFASRAAAVALNNNEPLIVSMLMGPAQAAVLGLTDRVYKVGQMLVNPLAGSVFYGLAHLSGEDTGGVRVRAVVKEILSLAAVFGSVVFAMAMALNGPFVSLWVGSDKFGGFALSAALAVAGLMTVRSNLLGMLLSALGEMRSSAWCTLAELLLRLPLLVLLVDRWGVIGMPLAVVGSSLFVQLWLYGRVLCERLGMRGMEAIRIVALGLPAGALALVAAFGVGAATKGIVRWRDFCASAVALAAVEVALALGIHRGARQLAFAVLDRVAPRGVAYLRGARGVDAGGRDAPR